MQLRALEEALVQADVIGGQPMLLAGPQNSREQTLELQLRLDRLQVTQPDLFAARLGELIYLANVLMAGSWYQGARFTESEAARAALACANLGLDAVVAEHARSTRPRVPKSSRRFLRRRRASCGCFNSAGICCSRCRCAAPSRCSTRCAPITSANS